uniref:Uncharacterized protein n=1 Tax=Anguilla anguilla TaxID=7936 RepID=A0A0E9WY63_ANGAN
MLTDKYPASQSMSNLSFVIHSLPLALSPTLSLSSPPPPTVARTTSSSGLF